MAEERGDAGARDGARGPDGLRAPQREGGVLLLVLDEGREGAEPPEAVPRPAKPAEEG